MLVLPLAVMAQAVDAPRTVNGGILGEAEDFKTAGPARVCLASTMIDVEAGETAYLSYLGIHWGSIRVLGPRGEFLVREGSWRDPPGGRAELDRRGRTIVRHRRGGRPAYLIYSTPGVSDEAPVVWIEGSALGRSRDRSIIDRVSFAPGGPRGCTRQYDYGWEWLLGPSEDETKERP